MVSVGVGELEAAGFGVATGVVRGGGVLGTSNRPRRGEAVGKADADETGVDVVNGVADCSGVADLRGVITDLGVEVAERVGEAVTEFSGGAGRIGAFCCCDGVAMGVAVDCIDAGAVRSLTGVDVDVADVSAACVLVAPVAFTNFFGGAFAGGVASDFILSRVFLAAS